MKHQEAFHYIVVGAGSAGCAVASRLSENPDHRVLLLEAGGDDDKKPRITTPVFFVTNFKTEDDWNYSYAPNPHTNNRQDYMPRGKVLGGSSSINAMIYQRGDPENYDQWKRAGNAGWGWKDVLPYFLKAEHQERGKNAFHAVNGPLNVSDLRSPSEISKAFVEGCKELGYRLNEDFNNGQQEGFGLYQVTMKNGQRCSSSHAYLDPIRNRKNLCIRSRCLVKKVLIESDVCVGVEYIQDGAIHKVLASKEVILCGGALNTPQIMMLSGLGPRECLESCGIKVLHDIPGVGKNLHDHASVILNYYTHRPTSLDDIITEKACLEYQKNRTGPLASNIAESGGFVRLSQKIPELQYHLHTMFCGEHGFNSPQGHGVSLVISVTSPLSRGFLKITSGDPSVHPWIDGNLLSHEQDVKTLIEGIKIGRHLMKSQALKRHVTKESLPGDWVVTDKDLEEFIRRHGTHIYHPVGTCKMGSDEMSVVNHKLQVRNINRLRIADASIMPTIVNANTNAPSIMIGEKCADMVQKEELYK